MTEVQTIEKEYELQLTFKGHLFIPDYYDVDRYTRHSIEKYRELICPSEYSHYGSEYDTRFTKYEVPNHMRTIRTDVLEAKKIYDIEIFNSERHVPFEKAIQFVLEKKGLLVGEEGLFPLWDKLGHQLPSGWYFSLDKMEMLREKEHAQRVGRTFESEGTLVDKKNRVLLTISKSSPLVNGIAVTDWSMDYTDHTSGYLGGGLENGRSIVVFSKYN